MDKNQQQYRKLEKTLVDLQAKAGKKFGDTKQVRPGLVWFKYNSSRSDNYRRAVDKIDKQLKTASISGNRKEYLRLEKIREKIEAKAPKKLKGFSKGFTPGEVWKTYAGSRLEGKFADVAKKLREEMKDAALNGDVKKYSKFEAALFKLRDNTVAKFVDVPGLKDLKKGSVWNLHNRDYLPNAEKKLRKAAVEGNRKEYNKIEREILKLDPNRIQRGRAWKEERVNVVADRLREQMEEAVRANDRAKYDRLEAKFLRMRDKLGNYPLNDRYLEGMSKGDLWKLAKSDNYLSDLRGVIRGEKGKNVESVQITGDKNSFTVASRILGNKLEVTVSPNGSTSFMVNGSYTVTKDLSKREIFAITREVTRQYEEIMKNMKEGTVFAVNAAGGDGREGMRTKAYIRFGFSKPDEEGSMFGMVKGGKIVPISWEEYEDKNRTLR